MCIVTLSIVLIILAVGIKHVLSILSHMSRDTRTRNNISPPNMLYALVIVMMTAILVMTVGFAFLSSSTRTTDEIIAQRPPAHPYPFAGGHYNFGTISSVQLDKNGIPEWVLSGHWKSNLLNISTTTRGISSNQTNTTSSAPEFDASIRMVMVNGSAPHTHTITNFKLLKITNSDKNTKEFNGTATISLKTGPTTDVPISIKFSGNNVISIWLDQAKINNHFGKTPIFGTIFKPFRMPPPPSALEPRGP
jgi:hypothetical protein